MSKYAILLTAADSDAFEDFARIAKRHTRRRTVRKRDVIRTLIFALSDPDDANAVLAHLTGDV